MRRGWRGWRGIVVPATLAVALVAGCDNGINASSDAPRSKQLIVACRQLERSGAVDVDVEVFMNVLATDGQQDGVRAMLLRMPGVERVTFLSKRDAFRVFQRLFRDRPRLIRDTTPEILPTSFRVYLRQGVESGPVRSEAMFLPGVDEVKVADPAVKGRC